MGHTIKKYVESSKIRILALINLLVEQLVWGGLNAVQHWSRKICLFSLKTSVKIRFNWIKYRRWTKSAVSVNTTSCSKLSSVVKIKTKFVNNNNNNTKIYRKKRGYETTNFLFHSFRFLPEASVILSVAPPQARRVMSHLLLRRLFYKMQCENQLEPAHSVLPLNPFNSNRFKCPTIVYQH